MRERIDVKGYEKREFRISQNKCKAATAVGREMSVVFDHSAQISMNLIIVILRQKL